MQRKEGGNAQTRVRNVLHDGKSGGRPPRIGSLSVITLMHRPGCTSPHLRLRISSVTTLDQTVPPSLSLVLLQTKKPLDSIGDRSNQWDKEARRSVCVQIVTVRASPLSTIDNGQERNFSQSALPSSSRIFVASFEQIPSPEIPEKKFDTAPRVFFSFFFSRLNSSSPTSFAFFKNRTTRNDLT